MANERAGLNFLLKADTDGGPTYATLGGLRAKTWNHENEEIDVTNHGSNSWKERLYGVRSLTISGSGIAKDDAALTALKTASRGRTKIMLQLTDGDETLTAAFLITSFELAGEYNGAQEYSITAVSDGEVAVS